nr:unnamed protein product [Spirometra erinaceieuropaei]
MKTGAAIYGATRITADKAKREAHESQLRLPPNANAQPPPDLLIVTTEVPGISRSHWTSSYQLQYPDDTIRCHLVHLCLATTPKINTDHAPEPQLPSFSNASTSTATTPVSTAHNPDTSINTNRTILNTCHVNSVHTCPHCDRTFARHIGLVGHLRIHRTETDEPVPGAPTYTKRIHLNYPQCTCTFTHLMDLLATCAFAEACSRQPSGKPHNHIFLHLHHAASSPNTSIQLPPPK